MVGNGAQRVKKEEKKTDEKSVRKVRKGRQGVREEYNKSGTGQLMRGQKREKYLHSTKNVRQKERQLKGGCSRVETGKKDIVELKGERKTIKDGAWLEMVTREETDGD